MTFPFELWRLKHRCEDRFFANSSYRPLLPPMTFLSFSWFKFPYRDDYSLLANWQLLGKSCHQARHEKMGMKDNLLANTGNIYPSGKR